MLKLSTFLGSIKKGADDKTAELMTKLDGHVNKFLILRNDVPRNLQEMRIEDAAVMRLRALLHVLFLFCTPEAAETESGKLQDLLDKMERK